MIAQVGAALATGNVALVLPPPDPNNFLIRLPPALHARVQRLGDPREAPCDLVLYEGDADDLLHWQRAFADLPGPVVPFHALRARRAAGRQRRFRPRLAAQRARGQHQHRGRRRQCQPDEHRLNRPRR